MSLQALIQAGLNPRDALGIALVVQASEAHAIDEAVALAEHQRPRHSELVAQARRAWWSNPAIPLEWKRLLDARVVNEPAGATALTPLASAQQIVTAAKSAGLTVELTRPALYRLWAEARDRYLDLQEDDGTLPADIGDMSWGELCALYVKCADPGSDHPAQVLGLFLGLIED